jgi:ABC-type nitrate/sulfonate/bicarbonate transport system substrate-binding protein
VHELTIGFDAVPALLGGHVAAATAFWDVEGVALHRARPAIREFRVDDYGAPAYPELVVCTTAGKDPNLVRAIVKALERGYAVTKASPQASAGDELRAVPGLDRSLFEAELTALHGAFAGGPFDRGQLGAWAAWEARFGIVKQPPDVAAMFPS